MAQPNYSTQNKQVATSLLVSATLVRQTWLLCSSLEYTSPC